MKIRIGCIALFAAMLALNACKKEAASGMVRVPQLPEQTEKYAEVASGTFATGSVIINNERATLGRVLFYETQLSVNNSVSCGTCHLQSKGFADLGAVSTGFGGGRTSRNTPSIVNAATQSSYFWDMRENNLQNMVTQPIANHLEMGLEQPEYMIAKLKQLPYYEDLFVKAFGDANITSTRIGDALSQFVASMVSVNTKFDRNVASGNTEFNELEEMGRALFFNELPCATCHGGDNFSGWGSIAENIGLDEEYSDPGMPGTDWMTGEERNGWFKVPTLRNIALTGPYMHDGRFATLEEVVDFYNSGVQAHPQLSFALREGWNSGGFVADDGIFEPMSTNAPPIRMNLTNLQKQALVAFLKTLTDDQLVTQAKYSDPFVLSAND
jgi:cytochrome c peroxidase